MGKKMGRPRIAIDWQLVEDLCRIQCTEQEIAQVIRCDISTLCRASKREFGITFAEYIGQKRAGGKCSLRRKQWKLAVDQENVTMLIWLGKQHLGQNEKVEQKQEIKAEVAQVEYKTAWANEPSDLDS